MQERNAGGSQNIVDLTVYSDKCPYLKEVPSEIVVAEFRKRRCKGEGIYCVRFYDERIPNRIQSVMSGVIWDEKTGDASLLKSDSDPRTKLVGRLAVFYEAAAKQEIKTPDDTSMLREGNVSFLAVRCQYGIIATGWYDTYKEESANGMKMLAFVLQTLSALNPHDAVLRKAISSNLLDALAL